MLNWKEEIRKANAKVQEQVERHLAKQQVQQVASVVKADKPKRKRSTVPKVELNNWDVDLSVIPDNVKRVENYFKSPVKDSIHRIASSVPNKPVKKTAQKVKNTKKVVKTVVKSTLRIINGKRVWTHQGDVNPSLLARLGLA